MIEPTDDAPPALKHVLTEPGSVDPPEGPGEDAAVGLAVREGRAAPGAGGEEGDGVALSPPKPSGSTNGADCPAMAGTRSAARFIPASSGRKTVTASTAMVIQATPRATAASFGHRPVARPSSRSGKCSGPGGVSGT